MFRKGWEPTRQECSPNIQDNSLLICVPCSGEVIQNYGNKNKNGYADGVFIGHLSRHPKGSTDVIAILYLRTTPERP